MTAARLLRTTLVRSTLAVFIVTAAALAATSPAQAGGGGCHGSRTTGSGDTVDLEANCFGPTVLHVEPGTTVTWTNQDNVVHTVTGAGGIFGSTQLLKDDTFSHTFDESGVFPYVCVVHPTMLGAVVVGDAASTGTPAAIEGNAASEGASTGAVAPAVLLGLGGLVVGAAGVSVGPRLLRRD